jgi:hypothetical protein
MGFPRLEVPFAAMAPASEKDGVKVRPINSVNEILAR